MNFGELSVGCCLALTVAAPRAQAESASVLHSPRLAMSPFAKQTQQPFVDSASCRSRLSDYGFTSDESDNEQDWEGCYGDDMVTPVKGEGPPEGCGFWAEVGAIGALSSLCCDSQPQENWILAAHTLHIMSGAPCHGKGK